MDRQVCLIKTVAYRARKDTRTDKKVKTEGPKVLSNYIFYFKTVIGGPISVIYRDFCVNNFMAEITEMRICYSYLDVIVCLGTVFLSTIQKSL